MSENPDEEESSLRRSSGIPPRGSLGASRNEMIALVLGVLVLIAIGFSFCMGTRP